MARLKRDKLEEILSDLQKEKRHNNRKKFVSVWIRRLERNKKFGKISLFPKAKSYKKHRKALLIRYSRRPVEDEKKPER